MSSQTRPIRAASSPTVADAARVLVVEDEESLADSVRYNLEREGYAVSVATDGRRALERFRADAPALVILDLMLPEVSGLDLCRMMRAESDVPIIMVTAKDSEADKVTGLELGADDYVTKPFSMRELVSRVRANLRRTKPQAVAEPVDEVISGGPVRMDVGRHEVSVRGESVALPPKEFELLETFLRRRGRLLTREFLIDEVWGPDYFGDTRTLDVHVKRLRRKLEDDPHYPRYLLTVRGLGYKFVD
ncbi:MAG TPA: response regulator transcription factor [Actinomycetota bacterium]|nr:response regulator transcription factor [Actinomycetota bacterium]